MSVAYRSTTGLTRRTILIHLMLTSHLLLICCLFLVFFPRLMTILREEGPAALYKGFVPKVLRLAPGGGVLLLVVEFTLSVFRKSTLLKLLSPQLLFVGGSLVLIIASFQQLLALLTCRRWFCLALCMISATRWTPQCFQSRQVPRPLSLLTLCGARRSIEARVPPRLYTRSFRTTEHWRMPRTSPSFQHGAISAHKTTESNADHCNY